MSEVVATLQGCIANVIALLWLPLMPLSQSAALAISATVFGVTLVILYGCISPQESIRRVKNEISGYILETFLFRHSTKLSLTAQARLFWSGVRYFTFALGPVLLLALPCTVILGHLNLRLGYRPLQVGEEGILKVSVVNPVALTSLQIATSHGVVATGPVRVPKENSAYWKLTAKDEGEFPLSFPSGNSENLFISSNETTKPLGLFVPHNDWVVSLLFPNGGASISLPLQGIEFTYPEAMYRLFGVELSWITAFLIVSILTGYVGSKIFRIAV